MQYNDPDDRKLKEYVHMIFSFAFVPVEDVESTLDSLRDACLDKLLPVMEYFEHTYIRDRPAARRGRGCG